MSLIVETLIFSAISAGGLAVLSKVGLVSGINIYNYYKQKKSKKKLKKKLKKALQNYNYQDFQDIIYRIQSYDDVYNKYLYVKMKRKYFFTDKCVDDIYYFNKRFNMIEDITSPTILRKIVNEEIEKSLNKNYIDL